MTTNPPPPAVRACLFDMDGLLLDSEEKYTLVTNLILNECGRPNLPWNIKAQLQGRPAPEAGRIFHEWAQLPISREEYYAKAQALQAVHFLECKPLSGVPELLRTLSHTKSPKVHIALATSSHRGNFELKTRNNQELFSVFAEENRVLGDDPRIPKGRGKPAPDIYLLALKTINDRLRRDGNDEEVKPEECLVFEDSVPGVESGRRAGMQVVWCPHPELAEEYAGREKEILAGLMGEYKEEIKPKVETAGQKVAGAPGEIDDGWAVQLSSLENFPYSRFQISV